MSRTLHNGEKDQVKVDSSAEISQDAVNRGRQESKHHRIMHRIPANNKVRRRLFPEENIEEQARIDNFANILQESAARDRQEKSKKWGFDFINEVPLDGDYEWYKKDGGEWIGMKIKCEDPDVSKLDTFLTQKFENENTPMHARDDAVPSLLRKRRRDAVDAVGNQAKRKVNFDECNFLSRTDN